MKIIMKKEYVNNKLKLLVFYYLEKDDNYVWKIMNILIIN